MIDDKYILDFFKCNGKYVSRRFNEHYINKVNSEIYNYLINRFADIDEYTTLKEIVYRIENKLEDVPRCCVCNKRLIYKSGYGSFCSRKCQQSEIGHKIWNEKIQETMLNKYGVKYALQSQKLKQKQKNNLIKKYGVDNVFKLDTVKDKIITTNLQRYGVKRAQQNETIKNKIRNTFNTKYYSETEEANRLKAIKLKKSKETMLKHHGVEHALQNNDILEQMKNNNIQKYGVPYVMQNNEIKEKMLQTINSRYGVSSITKLDYIQEKIKQTNKERYGVEFIFQHKLFRDKSKQTNLEKYGVEFPIQSASIKNKIKETNLEKYGVENPFSSTLIKNKIKETNLERYGVEYAAQSDVIKTKIKETNLNRYGFSCTLCNNDVRQVMQNNIINKYGSIENFWKYRYDQITISIKKNKNNGMTLIEQKTYNYLLTLFDKSDIQFNIIVDERYPFHVDFYIKSKDLFIEINAFWTHGKHKFDSNNIDDLKLLEQWKQKAINSKQYLAAIKIWTEIDPLKIETSINNHLNYLPIWSNKIEEVKCIINNYFEN